MLIFESLRLKFIFLIVFKNFKQFIHKLIVEKLLKFRIESGNDCLVVVNQQFIEDLLRHKHHGHPVIISKALLFELY